MPYPIELKEKAITLRKNGFSLKEISEKISIAKSTASVWLSDVLVSPSGQKRLADKQILGQYKTVLLKKAQKKNKESILALKITKLIESIQFSQEMIKLCCSLLYFCEGNKGRLNLVRFTNSDPSLVQLFLSLLRTGFSIDESKLRILMHLHYYHNEEQQKLFWSNATSIPPKQFNRSFWKENTAKNKRKDYPGCVAITYYSADVVKELVMIYNIFTFRGVV